MSELDLSEYQGPILFVANHVSSADSWVAIKITALLRRKAVVLAQARVLRIFPWLAWLGFTPLSKKNPATVLETFQATARRARSDATSAIWFYPEGTHSPSSGPRRPLQPGILGLLRMLPAHTLVVPVTLHYFVFRQPRMAICAAIGEPIGEAGRLAKAGRAALVEIDAHLTRTYEAAMARVLVVSESIRFPFERGDLTL